MKSLKQILIAIILIPLLIIGGIKGYMHYQLKSNLEQLARQFSVFGTFEYGDISTSLSGRLSVENIRLRFHDLNDVIRIKAVHYSPDSLWFLLTKGDKLKQGYLPESMQLAVEGLNMDLFGDITEKVEDVINELNFQMKGVNPLCGGRLFIGPREYREMGYEELTTDFSIGYLLDMQNQQLLIDIKSNVKDMVAAHIRATVSGISDTRLSRLYANPNPPRLKQISMQYIDKSYTRRFVKMCAELSNLSKQEFIEAEANQKPIYFASTWGIIPGAGLRQAYKRFLSNPGKVEFSMELPESVELKNIDLFKAEDIPQLLKLKLVVNGENINDLSFKFYSGKRPQLGKDIKHLFGKEEKTSEAPAKATKKKKPQKRYREVSARRLPKYIGRQIRLVTDNGKHREGTLTSITDNTLHIRQNVYKGTFEMTVPLSRVKKAEVLLEQR